MRSKFVSSNSYGTRGGWFGLSALYDLGVVCFPPLANSALGGTFGLRPEWTGMDANMRGGGAGGDLF